MTTAALYARSPQPLFIQAAGQLRLRIEAGDWPSGGRLPALDALQAEFGLSRATMRGALELLERDGLIQRRRGRGAYVRPDLAARHTYALPTTWRALIASLEDVETELVAPLSRVNASALRGVVAGAATGVFAHLRRIHRQGDEPYCLIDIHVRQEIFDANRDEILARPIILLFAEQSALALARVGQRVTFSSADEVTAAALDIALGAPIVEIVRTLVDRDGAVLAHTYVRYPGERVRLEFTFEADCATGAGRPEDAP
ncbi:MAG: GntR family transcriptional regulator [Hyphomicrobiales bacterium]|nr:GntR family transcriptional regulator [Hyphomicrobiales bacterium]